MKHQTAWTTDWLWLAAIVFVASMHFWFPSLRPGIPHDTYSTEAEGKKAFYLLLREETARRNLQVARSFHPLDHRLAGTPARNIPLRLNEPAALCLLGPERYPNAKEWFYVLRWVKAGGTLVFAARDDRPALHIEPLDISIKPLSEWESETEASDDAGLVRTTLVREGNLYWETGGWIDAPKAQPLIQFGGTVQAAIQEHGYGKVIVVATDFLFSNQSMAWEDNSVLAFALTMARPDNPIQPHLPVRRIAIDESLNVTGTPKVVGLLFLPRLRPMTIQLVILALAFAWWRSRRFGPRLPAPVPPRRNIVDHTDALGQHAYRAKAGQIFLRSYLQQLRMDLKLLRGPVQDDERIASLARRLNQPPEAIRQLLQEAEAATKSPRLKRRHAADFIRRLAMLREAKPLG